MTEIPNYSYYERCFSRYFGLNLKPFIQTSPNCWWLDMPKFKRIIYAKCGFSPGTDEKDISVLEEVIETHFGRNARLMFENLLGEELPF